MSYIEDFTNFWKTVEYSIQRKEFAKLTMAKTIGKPNLRNIFLRPVYSSSGFKVLLKFHYRSKEMEDTEEALELDKAFKIIESHLKTSFQSVILFTTSKDLTFKINKKGSTQILESPPSFTNIAPVNDTH